MVIIMCGACSGVPASKGVIRPAVTVAKQDKSSGVTSSRRVTQPTSPINPVINIIHKMRSHLTQLQNEMQQMRGVIEEQSQTIVHLKKRQNNIYKDIDLRLQKLADHIRPSKHVSGGRVSKPDPNTK